MHEFDRTDTLRERKIPIDRMFARDDGSIAAKPGQRDMRPKRPLVRLPKREKKLGAQLREIGPGRAFRPQKARASWLRTVSDMPEFQSEIAEPVGDATKLPDRIRDRNLIPWRHQREMNVGGAMRRTGNRSNSSAICASSPAISGAILRATKTRAGRGPPELAVGASIPSRSAF